MGVLINTSEEQIHFHHYLIAWSLSLFACFDHWLSG